MRAGTIGLMTGDVMHETPHSLAANFLFVAGKHWKVLVLLTSSSAHDEPAEPSVGAAPRARVKPSPATGILLVSKAFTEINAGLVIVFRSMHTCPVAYELLREETRDSDELAETVTQAYHQHVERYLATTRPPPTDIEAAVSSGLLASLLLGTWTEYSVDWCHAWSILGQWSSWVTFPVPQSGQWPRHGHLRGIAEGYRGRQPNFHKWARPAYEQGALPTLSLLPGAVAVRVLPGDKNYMRPAILHGFGASAKSRAVTRPGRIWPTAHGSCTLWHADLVPMDAP